MEAYSDRVAASNRDADHRIVQQEESTASHGVRNPLLSSKRVCYVLQIAGNHKIPLKT